MGKAQEKHKKSLQWLGSGLFWQAVVGIGAVCLGSGPFGWALGPGPWVPWARAWPMLWAWYYDGPGPII